MMKQIYVQKGSTHKGFTLVETLVAITILMVAITGPLVFVSDAINQATYAKQQITAFYLAQDAIEQVRNIRDSNAIQSRDGSTPPNTWLIGTSNALDLTPCLNGDGYGTNNMCVISAASPSPHDAIIKKCNIDFQGDCPPLSYDSSSFKYGYPSSGGYGDLDNSQVVTSIYTRVVKITEIVPNTEAQVAVTINWNTQYQPRTFTVVEDLFNWAGN